MNIAEILKYCPEGIKLYTTIWGEVTFIEVSENVCNLYPIVIYNECDHVGLTKDGRYLINKQDSECILFPSKDQRDWSKFRLPLKRGDIMMKADGTIPFIASGEFYEDTSPKYICGVDITGHFSTGIYGWTSEFYIPASEEAKKELFDKMIEAGYRWNTDTLKLEKIESEFKEGDVLINEDGDLYLFINKITNCIGKAAILYANGNFITEAAFSITSDGLTLAKLSDKNKLFSFLIRKGYKYDKEQNILIKQEFKPFDRVLVRDKDTDTWEADIYLGYNEEDKYYHYKCTRGNYQFCIPYEGNEYILGTTNYSA